MTLPLAPQGKTFWQRPEGTFAKIVTAGLGGLLIFKYGLALLGFISSMIWTTVNIALGLAILGAIVYVIWDGRLLRAGSYLYKNLMRGLFNWITSNDPIG